MKNFVQDCPFLKPIFRALHICPYSALILLELAQAKSCVVLPWFRANM